MLKVHFAPNSRAGRIIWLMEELELEYEVNVMPFSKEGLKSDEHRARHALGRVPVLEDGEVMIFESGAIIEYVLTRHKEGGLKPKTDSPEFPYYLQWFHYCEGMIMPPINTIVVHTILLPEDRRDPVALGQAQRLLGRALQVLEEDMGDRDYVAGGFTIADTMIGHAVLMSERMGIVDDNFPNLTAYAARLKQRPALQRAFEIEQS